MRRRIVAVDEAAQQSPAQVWLVAVGCDHEAHAPLRQQGEETAKAVAQSTVQQHALAVLRPLVQPVGAAGPGRLQREMSRLLQLDGPRTEAARVRRPRG